MKLYIMSVSDVIILKLILDETKWKRSKLLVGTCAILDFLTSASLSKHGQIIFYKHSNLKNKQTFQNIFINGTTFKLLKGKLS